MKLYHRVSRFRFRRWFPKGGPQERKLLWGASLKPGDVIGACSGFNVRVQETIPERRYVEFVRVTNSVHVRRSRRQGWAIVEFTVLDQNGGRHHTSNCCWPKETVAQIEAFWRDLLPASSLAFKIHEALRAGQPICDDDGIALPEFNPHGSP